MACGHAPVQYSIRRLRGVLQRANAQNTTPHNMRPRKTQYTGCFASTPSVAGERTKHNTYVGLRLSVCARSEHNASQPASTHNKRGCVAVCDCVACERPQDQTDVALPRLTTYNVRTHASVQMLRCPFRACGRPQLETNGCVATGERARHSRCVTTFPNLRAPTAQPAESNRVQSSRQPSVSPIFEQIPRCFQPVSFQSKKQESLCEKYA